MMTACVELRCTECGGTIAPGTTFQDILDTTGAGKKGMPIAGITGTYMGRSIGRICSECVVENAEQKAKVTA
jgi:adenosylcobinamide amidohydrolase